ncbi:MAG: hypothetical protein AAFO61_03640 [Pseudomonadota bacterium]
MGDLTFRQQLDNRLYDLLPNTEFRRMVDAEDREAVLDMRYEGYRKSFPVRENWNGFTDPFDACDNTTTFGVFVGSALASTIRLSIITAEAPDAQAMAMYGERLQPKLETGCVLMDVTRLVVNPTLADRVPELPYLTFRIVAMACQHYGVDETISALRLKHVPFYRRMFGGQVIGDPVWYEPLQSDFALVSFPLSAITEDLSKRFSSWLSTYMERRMLFGRADMIPGISEEHSLAA